MQSLDRHISVVRTRVGLERFLSSLALGLLGLATLSLLVVLAERLVQFRVPAPWVVLGVLGGLVLVAAVVVALRRRPAPIAAAAEIDARLGLKEKFSTAVFAREGAVDRQDPFLQAALADALAQAQSVDLRGHFPIRAPRLLGPTVGVALLTAAAVLWMPDVDLLGVRERREIQAQQLRAAETAKQNVEAALSAIDAAPPAVADQEQIRLARQDLQQLLGEPITDPSAANRQAMKATTALQESLKQQVAQNQKFAQAQQDAKTFRQMGASDEAGPVAEAQREIAKGNFEKAVEELKDVAQNFGQMDAAQQQQAARQMEQMANQLQQIANDPQQMQQLVQQAQQMGIQGPQLQQLAGLMQQAAQGQPGAAQQLQQAAQQAMAQMNNGQGPDAQQQQQIQQLVNQMQAAANAQANAQQMQQAAQQMAQAMQQAAAQQQAGGGGEQGGQQQGGQQQQGGPQQAGQQAGQQGGQGMQQGMQQMQQALDQMDALQQDAKQIEAAQRAAQRAQQQMQQGQQQNQQGQGQDGQGGDGQGQGEGQNGQGQGGQGGQGQGGQGQGQQGGGGQPGGAGGQQGNGQGAGAGQQPGGQGGGQPGGGQGDGQQGNAGGMGGAGRGQGGRAPVSPAPFDFVEEFSQSHDDETGRVLASSFVKSDQKVGDSTAELQAVVESNRQLATDEVEQQRISRQAQRAIRDYFQSVTRNPETPNEDSPRQ